MSKDDDGLEEQVHFLDLLQGRAANLVAPQKGRRESDASVNNRPGQQNSLDVSKNRTTIRTRLEVDYGDETID